MAEILVRSPYCVIVEGVVDYFKLAYPHNITVADSIPAARKLLSERCFDLLIVDPYSEPISPKNPMVSFIREASDKKVPVVVFSTLSEEQAIHHFGIDSTMYQGYAEQPISLGDDGLGGIVNRLLAR
jgi:hypothetical protein